MNVWIFATVLIGMAALASIVSDITKGRAKSSAAVQAVSGIDEIVNGKRRTLSDEAVVASVGAICDRYFDRKDKEEQ